MPEPGAGAVRVLAPATSANLGPGFDALGLALGLHDEVAMRVDGPDRLRVDYLDADGHPDGTVAVPLGEDNLVVRSARAAFDRVGGQPARLAVSCRLAIPQGRGLGSSAAAIVAGILAARALVPDGGRRLPAGAVLALAAELEGHPDNVAACLLGGLAVAWRDGEGGTRAVRVPVAAGLRAVVYVPAQQSSTEATRGLLPDAVPHAVAAANAGRAALLMHALAAEPQLLLAATEDALHQPYRAAAMPGSAALMAGLRTAGHAAVISGAGPTVLVLDSSGAAPPAPPGWRRLPLAVDTAGARTTILE